MTYSKNSRRAVWVAAAALVGIFSLAPAGTRGEGKAEPKATPGPVADVFRKNVKTEVAGDYLVVRSDGIPDHPTGNFPNRTNPNTIQKQDYTFRLPLKPVRADTVTKLPMGPIGVAVNGVPFYNPYNREGQDAAKNEVFDECCGHPDPRGRYHYHIYPKCVKTPFAKDEAGQHSALLGYAFDGFAIYGPLGENGKAPADLDECNGHEDATRGYHYHVTDHFPYIIGGYRGVVARGNLDGPRRGPGFGPPPGAPGFGRDR